MIIALQLAGVIVVGFLLFALGFVLGDVLRARHVRPCEYCRSNEYPRGTYGEGTWRCHDLDGCRSRSARQTEKG